MSDQAPVLDPKRTARAQIIDTATLRGLLSP
jgi:hypothetical protein